MFLISQIPVPSLLLLAAFATYLSAKNLVRKEIEMGTTRARVFLDRSFLNAPSIPLMVLKNDILNSL
jgi:hypothetical protein